MQGLVGKILDHTYRVEPLLGQGGMGAVYRAVDIRLNRTVALKVMLGGPFSSTQARLRFQREVELAAGELVRLDIRF